MKLSALLLALAPVAALADGIKVEDPFVPTAPPTARAHAAYMMLKNENDTPMQLIGVTAEGYAMAHLHRSEEKDGIATMSAVEMVEIAPGQTVAFERGGLHVMLMRPDAPVVEGSTVSLMLEFADGTTETVIAPVKPLHHGHADHSHGS